MTSSGERVCFELDSSQVQLVYVTESNASDQFIDLFGEENVFIVERRQNDYLEQVKQEAQYKLGDKIDGTSFLKPIFLQNGEKLGYALTKKGFSDGNNKDLCFVLNMEK